MLVRLFVSLCIAGTILGGQVALWAYVDHARDLPEIPPFEEIRFGAVGTVRALHGQVLAETFEQRRYLVPRERIPKVLVDAVLASEDSRFFEHSGLDLKGIVRAVWTNLRAGVVREGASTITQQVARSLLLSNERSLRRKVREAILARRLEDIYDKDQILLLYLNLIYLGNGAHGVQAASRVYFGKDVADLAVDEAAIIAALPQSPGKVTPVLDPAAMRVRRDRVLRRMQEGGLITQLQEQEAMAREVRAVASHDNLGDRAPVPAMDALKTLKSLSKQGEPSGLLGSDGGFTTWTTIDLGLQLAAQTAAYDAAAALDRRQGFRGPLMNLPQAKWDEFARRNEAYARRMGFDPEPPTGRRVLVLVTAVAKEEARVTWTTARAGTMPLSGMSWAAPYSEFAIDPATGQREESARTSLDGRIDSVERALKPGDVVLAMRMPPPKPASAAKRPRKIGKTTEPEEPPAPPVDPGPPPLRFALAQIPRPQAALAAIEPRSGYLMALVGGTDFDVSQVDRTDSLRQTGSVIKPVYYSKAYDVGVPPSTVVPGAPFREGSWTPQGEKAVDDMTLWEALTRSENNASLRAFRLVLDRVGKDGLNEWAERLGLGRPFQGFAAEGLGIDATPNGILRAFATLATGGIRPDPTLVRLVTDDRGRAVVDRRSARDPLVPLLDALVIEARSTPDAARRAITVEAAWIASRNLRNVAEEGTARSTKKLARPVCGKTGTLPFDVWFAGWTSEVAAVAWLGQDVRERWLGRSRGDGRVFGADTALPAWVAFVGAATSGRPVVDDLKDPPEGVVVVPIDRATGLLAQAGEGILIPHMRGTEPTVLSSLAAQPEESAEAAEF